MKTRILIAGALLIGFAGAAAADEYYVVSNPSTHRCTVTTTRPAGQEVVTQIGPLAFKSRVEAEDRIKTTKICEEGTVGSSGSSSTTVIKEK